MLYRGILGLTLALILAAPAQAEYTFRPLNSGGGSGIGTVNGIVKGDGAGNPSAAVAGTDYVSPALTSGLIYVGSAGNLATGVPMAGDCTIIAAGTITCTKTNGSAFGAFATGTNASNLTGTVAAARGGFGADISASSGVPLFAAGVPTFTSTSGTGVFARVTNPTFTSGTVTVNGGANAPLNVTSNATFYPTISGTSNGADVGWAFSPLNGGGSPIASYLTANSGNLTMHGPPSGILAFGVDNGGGGLTELMRLDSSGRLGIGTASPTFTLDVARNANDGSAFRVVNSSAGAGATSTVTTNNGTNNAYFGVRGTGSSTVGTLIANDGQVVADQGLAIVGVLGSVRFAAGGTAEQMRLDTTGRLGIGTASPATQLHTTGGVRFAGLAGAGTLCASLDATGNMGRTACGGTGLPGAGSLSQVVLNSGAGTGVWATEPFTNITALTGADCTGAVATVISTVIGALKSIALPNNCTLKITGNDTIPAGVFFSIPCGARVQVDGAAILTFYAETDDNSCQKFSASGAGAGSGGGFVRGLRFNRPEWWGAFGDCALGGTCSHDDSGPIQQAVNSAQNSLLSAGGQRPQVKLGCNKSYGVSTGISATVSAGVPLDISGCSSYYYSILVGRSGFTGTILTVATTGSSPQTDFTLHDFGLFSYKNFQADTCLKIGAAGQNMANGAGRSFVHDIRMERCKHLLGFDGTVVSLEFNRIWMLHGSNSSILTLGAITAGSGYVDGSYVNVPLTGGAGANATANITVAGGAVTVVTVINQGTGYVVANALSASNVNLGGSGSGFSIPVASLSSGANASCLESNVTGTDVLSELSFKGISCDNAPNSDTSSICMNFKAAGTSFNITGTRIFDISCYASTTGILLQASNSGEIADFWCYSCQMDGGLTNANGFWLVTSGTGTIADVVIDKPYMTSVGTVGAVFNIDGSAGGTIKNIGLYGAYTAIAALRGVRLTDASGVNVEGGRFDGAFTNQVALINNCQGCLVNNNILRSGSTVPLMVLLSGTTDYAQACNNSGGGVLAPASVSASTATGTHNIFFGSGYQVCPNN